ncbi:MAG: HlyD family efflux transporter periplasmic adaptor subunit [Chloroflexota bacterium]
MNWSQKRWLSVAVAVFLVLVLAACSQDGSETESAAEGESDALTVSTEIDLVSAEGSVVPLAEAHVSFIAGGQVETILVSEGDVVTAGTPLIQLDSTDQMIGITQAEVAVTQANANIQTANAGLLSAQAGLEAAQIGVASAEAQLALVTADPTAEQLALSEVGLIIAQAGIGQAEGNQALVLEGGGSAAIAAAEAQLVAAQAQFDSVQKTYIPILQNEDITDEEVIEQAQLQLNAASANLAAAEAALAEARSGSSTSGDRTAAAAGIDVATSQLAAAQAQFDLLQVGAKAEQVAVAETGVEQAERAVTEAALQLAAAETAVTQAEAGLVEAEAALAAAQSALDKQVIAAPFDGVVSQINVKEGQIAGPGIPVVTMADFSEWQIETTDLTELNVVNIGSEFEAEISIDAFPDESLTGRIVDVATVSDIVRGDVTYRVTLALDDTKDLPLRWGMTAFITIDTDQ